MIHMMHAIERIDPWSGRGMWLNYQVVFSLPKPITTQTRPYPSNCRMGIVLWSNRALFCSFNLIWYHWRWQRSHRGQDCDPLSCETFLSLVFFWHRLISLTAQCFSSPWIWDPPLLAQSPGKTLGLLPVNWNGLMTTIEAREVTIHLFSTVV